MKPKRLGCEISAIKNLFNRNVENCESFKYATSVTSSNSFILGYLARHSNENVYQKDIEERFSITKSTTSKVLKLMEQNGLIERVDVKEDARLKKIILTEKGNAIHESVKFALDQIEIKALDGFSEEEKLQLFLYFDRIKENLKK